MDRGTFGRLGYAAIHGMHAPDRDSLRGADSVDGEGHRRCRRASPAIPLPRTVPRRAARCFHRFGGVGSPGHDLDAPSLGCSKHHHLHDALRIRLPAVPIDSDAGLETRSEVDQLRRGPACNPSLLTIFMVLRTSVHTVLVAWRVVARVRAAMGYGGHGAGRRFDDGRSVRAAATTTRVRLQARATPATRALATTTMTPGQPGPRPGCRVRAGSGAPRHSSQ